jgi:hypothetical protein
MHDDINVPGAIIRETFSAPNLIGEGESDPLVDRARELVDEDFPAHDSAD